MPFCFVSIPDVVSLGPGLWKLNVSILEEEVFVGLFTNFWKDWQRQSTGFPLWQNGGRLVSLVSRGFPFVFAPCGRRLSLSREIFFPSWLRISRRRLILVFCLCSGLTSLSRVSWLTFTRRLLGVCRCAPAHVVPFFYSLPCSSLSSCSFWFFYAELCVALCIFVYLLNLLKYFTWRARNDFRFRGVRHGAVIVIENTKARAKFNLPLFFKRFRSSRRRHFYRQWGACSIVGSVDGVLSLALWSPFFLP